MEDEGKTRAQLIEELIMLREKALASVSEDAQHLLDITERKKLMRAAQHARDYAEHRIHRREPLLVLDGELKIVSASRAFFQTYEVTPEETEGQLLYDLGNGQWDIPKLRELLEEILPSTTSSVEDYEVEHNFEQIGQRTMLLNARGIFREGHKAKLILLAIEDITERKKLMRAAQHAREYAENIVSTVREPLLVLDGELKIVSASRAFFQTYEVTPEETEGQLLYDLGNGQWDIPKLRELLEEILPSTTSSVEDYEVEHNFEQIGQRTMLLNARGIFREGHKAKLILLAIEDITERKRLGRLVDKHAADLTAVNKELEAFAYSVSHDLRAPLRGIDKFSQILLRDYADKLDDDGKDYLDRVSAGAKRMSCLIDELLELSRLTRAEMCYGPVDLSALVREIAGDLQSAEPQREVRVVVTDDAIAVTGDATLLRVAMTNLLANAWKFTSHHEHATIEFGTKMIKRKRVYYLRDDGAGFDMKDSDKLFGAFQRLHDATEFPGTGVGLATVQRVIHRHGGRIWAEGEVEKGATFYFTLPVRVT